MVFGDGDKKAGTKKDILRSRWSTLRDGATPDYGPISIVANAHSLELVLLPNCDLQLMSGMGGTRLFSVKECEFLPCE